MSVISNVVAQNVLSLGMYYIEKIKFCLKLHVKIWSKTSEIDWLTGQNKLRSRGPKELLLQYDISERIQIMVTNLLFYFNVLVSWIYKIKIFLTLSKYYSPSKISYLKRAIMVTPHVPPYMFWSEIKSYVYLLADMKAI